MKKIRTLYACMLAGLLAACGPDKAEIKDNVMASMQSFLDSSADFKEYGLAVDSLRLIHKEGNEYRGMADVSFQGEIYPVAIEVLADGSDVLWELDAMGFGFLLDHELAKLTEPEPAPQPSSWVVLVGSFAVEINATRLASKLQEVGFPAFKTRDGDLTAVLIGPMESQAEAKAVRDQLADKANIHGTLRSNFEA